MKVLKLDTQQLLNLNETPKHQLSKEAKYEIETIKEVKK